MKKYTFFEKDDWFINRDPVMNVYVLECLEKFMNVLRELTINKSKKLTWNEESINSIMPLVFANQGAQKHDWATQDVNKMMIPVNVFIEEVLDAYLALKKK